MDFLRSLAISASGLKAQAGRMRVISENIANADSLPTTKGGAPYQRKLPSFHRKFDAELGADMVKLGRVARDTTPFPSKFEPGHPAADASGYVKAPNVNPLIETMDLREAQRSYEANLNVVTATRRMLQQTLNILRS
jgi:flagellar basal-body rod protein FlgC